MSKRGKILCLLRESFSMKLLTWCLALEPCSRNRNPPYPFPKPHPTYVKPECSQQVFSLCTQILLAPERAGASGEKGSSCVLSVKKQLAADLTLLYLRTGLKSQKWWPSKANYHWLGYSRHFTQRHRTFHMAWALIWNLDPCFSIKVLQFISTWQIMFSQTRVAMWCNRHHAR